jgi:hypothetical protein
MAYALPLVDVNILDFTCSSSNFELAGSLRLPIAPDLATVGFP